MDKYENKKELTGKIVFLISFAGLGLMIYLLFAKPFLSIDEWFTNGLVKLGFMNIISLTSADVHPPLYYLIVKAVLKAFALLNIPFNEVILVKFISVIPYIVLLGFSLTKIRKEYGWYAGGLFAFTVLAMANFLTFYLTARMYSWGLLFIVISFIYALDILNKPSLKYWVLLSVFSVLGAYCFYATAITSICIYLFLLLHIIFEDRSELKNFIISCALNVILYLPWLFTLINQVSGVHKSYWIKTPTVESSITSFASAFPSFGFAIACVFSVIILAVGAFAAKRYYENHESDDYYILSGVFVFIGTVVLSIVVSLLFKPILLPRILVPAAGIFWLAFSILMSRFTFNKSMILVTLLILVIGCAGIANQYSEISDAYGKTVEIQNLLDDMNNNNTIVIFDMMTKYVRFFDELNETQQFYKFTIDNKTYRPDYITTLNLPNYNFKFNEDVAENSDKDIYFIVDKNSKIELPDDLNTTQVGELKNCIFIKVNSAS